MTRNGNNLLLAAFLLLAVIATGCQNMFMKPAPPAPATGVSIDPCEEQLHDLCGDLLLYYAAHKQLPASLDVLTKVGNEPTLPLACPLSRMPYKYDPVGLRVKGWPGRLIVYDAVPCHAGLRWGIVADVPKPGQPLTLRVVRPAENAIIWQEPQAAEQ